VYVCAHACFCVRFSCLQRLDDASVEHNETGRLAVLYLINESLLLRRREAREPPPPAQIPSEHGGGAGVGSSVMPADSAVTFETCDIAAAWAPLLTRIVARASAGQPPQSRAHVEKIISTWRAKEIFTAASCDALLRAIPAARGAQQQQRQLQRSSPEVPARKRQRLSGGEATGGSGEYDPGAAMDASLGQGPGALGTPSRDTAVRMHAALLAAGGAMLGAEVGAWYASSASGRAAAPTGDGAWLAAALVASAPDLFAQVDDGGDGVLLALDASGAPREERSTVSASSSAPGEFSRALERAKAAGAAAATYAAASDSHLYGPPPRPPAWSSSVGAMGDNATAETTGLQSLRALPLHDVRLATTFGVRGLAAAAGGGSEIALGPLAEPGHSGHGQQFPAMPPADLVMHYTAMMLAAQNVMRIQSVRRRQAVPALTVVERRQHLSDVPRFTGLCARRRE
jgi:hypothetical protein